MKLVKKIKKKIVILLCISMIMINVMPSFSEENIDGELLVKEVIDKASCNILDEILEENSEEAIETEIEVGVTTNDISKRMWYRTDATR